VVEGQIILSAKRPTYKGGSLIFGGRCNIKVLRR